MERLLKLKEAAELLNVHPKTVVRWIQAGKLRAVKPGRDWRIPESEVRRIMEGK